MREGSAHNEELNQAVEDLYDRIKTSPIVTATLRCHFEIEEILDSALEALAKNLAHLKLDEYIPFARKISWLRAFGPSPSVDEPEKYWRLIAALNSLRSKIAPKFEGPERDKAMLNLREKFNAFQTDGDWRVPVNESNLDLLVITTATVHSLAFLLRILKFCKSDTDRATPSNPPVAVGQLSYSIIRTVWSSVIHPSSTTADSKSVAGKNIESQPSNEQVALRAYFIGERRRNLGIPGDEVSDWVQAEREARLISRFCPEDCCNSLIVEL